jgi:hypothetical protein
MPSRTTHDPGALKKLIWTGLSAGSIALMGILAHRLTAGVWETVFREPAPGQTSRS